MTVGRDVPAVARLRRLRRLRRAEAGHENFRTRPESIAATRPASASSAAWSASGIRARRSTSSITTPSPVVPASAGRCRPPLHRIRHPPPKTVAFCVRGRDDSRPRRSASGSRSRPGEDGPRDRGGRGEFDGPYGWRPERGRAMRGRRRDDDGGSFTRDHLQGLGHWAAWPPSHPIGEGGQAAQCP